MELRAGRPVRLLRRSIWRWLLGSVLAMRVCRLENSPGARMRCSAGSCGGEPFLLQHRGGQAGGFALHDPELDATILFAAFPGAVVGDRPRWAGALCDEAAGGDAAAHQGADDRLRARQGEPGVHGWRAAVVGVALDLQLEELG